MGLEKLLRGLYGTVPQLDMDNQFARARVVRPLVFDFKGLADGIKRNNVGTAGIQLDVSAEIREGRVVIPETGQSFPLEGPPPKESGVQRRRLKIVEWPDPAATRAEILK